MGYPLRKEVMARGTKYLEYMKMANWWTTEEVLPKIDKVTKPWKFKVECKTMAGEAVCVTGNCNSLGHWRNDSALVLNHDNDDMWSTVSNISADSEVQYRYLVCIPVGDKLIVRRWETGVHARSISPEASTNSNCSDTCDIDVFGVYNNSTHVEKGWLTSETAVQLRLVNNPIQLWKNNMVNLKISIKVTAISLHSDQLDMGDTSELVNRTASWPITEISVLNDHERQFNSQSQFGRVYRDNECVVFQTLTDKFQSTAYLVDFYVDDRNDTKTADPLSHVGFSNVLPSIMTGGEGSFTVPISNVVQRRPIGQITLEYLVVTPLHYKSDMRNDLSSQWKASWHGLHIGHRGSGESFSGSGCADVRENTIASFRSAAEAGADLVEFDVQLSKDLIPILYHDYYVALSTQRKTGNTSECSQELSDVIKVPVKALTLDEVQSLKLFHVKEGVAKLKRHFSKDLELDHQAFPTLQQAFELIDLSVGFNIELKWTMVREDGTYELEHPIEINIYVDTILKVVLEHSGPRNCVFSSFHPDIVTMLRLKQNKYPVVFLTQGVTSKWPQYRDVRCHNVTMGIHHAVSASLLGLSVHTEDLLRDDSQVQQIKDAGLMAWTWGDDANDATNVARLRQLGVQAVINDRVLSQSNKNESVFLIQAREAAKL